jgi:signal transduction histidine kinase
MLDKLRIRPVVGDVLLTALALVAQLAPFWSGEPGEVGDRPWQLYAPAVAASVPLLWRRRAPFVVLVVSTVAAVSYQAFPLGPAQPIWYGTLVAIFTVAERGPRWQRRAVLVGFAVGAVALSGSPATTARGVVSDVAAYAMGRAWAARGLQARHLERENALAVARERARIARDLHDILGHGLTVMVAQAQAGAVDVRRSPERAEASFEAITRVGRDAIGQLRRVVADDPFVRPTLDGLPELAARVTNAGLRVTLTDAGTPCALDPQVEAAAYRIVQEALTNAVRHARASTVEVRVHWRERTLVVTVDDDGTSGGGPDVGGLGGGLGLAGMRERARACGGSVEAGPRRGARGFRVRAVLPVDGVRAPGAAPPPELRAPVVGSSA